MFCNFCELCHNCLFYRNQSVFLNQFFLAQISQRPEVFLPVQTNIPSNPLIASTRNEMDSMWSFQILDHRLVVSFVWVFFRLNNPFANCFLPEGAVIEGGITPVRDQADAVPRFTNHQNENWLNKPPINKYDSDSSVHNTILKLFALKLRKTSF